MMSVTKYIIWFSLVSEFNQLEPRNDGPQFVLEYHDYVTAWIGDITGGKIEEFHQLIIRYTSRLTREKRIELCYAAKKFVGATVDISSPITEVPLRSIYENRLVMQCETLPVMYLEPEGEPADNKWTTWINKNRMATEHKFEVKKEVLERMPSSENLWDDLPYIDLPAQEFEDFIHSFEATLVAKSYIFSKFTSTDHLFFCIAAKDENIRGDDFPVHQVPVMLSTEVEEPRVYDFGNTKRVALKCPSAPVMYIYFKAARFDTKEVLVELVSIDSEPEPMTTL